MIACRVLESADLLRSYALSRGWVAASGLPDETRSGRQILKDFVNGKLLHCERPPACPLSNSQLGLTGQNATASKHAASDQGRALDTAALEADQAGAQTNGNSHSQSDGVSDSASEAGQSSDQDSQGGTATAGSAAAVSSSSDTEEAPAAHTGRLTDADHELMESLSTVQGTPGENEVSVLQVQPACRMMLMLTALPVCPLCHLCDLELNMADPEAVSCGLCMQLLKASPRGQSISSRRSQLARKATGAKLMMATQHMMARPSPQDDVVA